MFQCCKYVSSVFQVCVSCLFKCVFKFLFRCVSSLFQMLFKSMFNCVFKCVFKCLSSVFQVYFQVCFKWVSGVFQVCFKCVSSVFQVCFGVCLSVFLSFFQVCFKLFQVYEFISVISLNNSLLTLIGFQLCIAGIAEIANLFVATLGSILDPKLS